MNLSRRATLPVVVTTIAMAGCTVVGTTTTRPEPQIRVVPAPEPVVPSAVAVNNASDYSRASDLARRGPRLEHKQHSTFGVRVPRIEPREPREGTYRHGIRGVGGLPDPNPNQANSAHTTAQRQRLHLTSASILNSLTPLATT